MASNPPQKVGPTVLGKLVLIIFIIACIGGAAYYFRDYLAPSGQKAQKPVDIDAFKSQQGKVEAPDTKGITTVKEYKYIPGDKLPPVKGVSNYKWDTRRRSSTSRSTCGSAGCRSSPPTTASRLTRTASSPRSTGSRSTSS